MTLAIGAATPPCAPNYSLTCPHVHSCGPAWNMGQKENVGRSAPRPAPRRPLSRPGSSRAAPRSAGGWRGARRGRRAAAGRPAPATWPSAQRFPPLDAAQVRQLALAFEQGSMPVEVLLLRLAGAGLAPTAAQQLLVDLRRL